MADQETEKAGVRIRFMDVTDLDGVLELENRTFSTPWSRDAFYNEIVKNQFAYYTVAESAEGAIVGYCGLWVIIDDAHITNIAVDPEWRREGIGERMMSEAMAFAKKRGAERLSLEVRVSNTAAQAMYRKYGLQDGGIRKQYYTDNQEDALVMWVRL
ncbi:ribosomal protein S18-alanine N-acetyltransferase [Salisediminibacterium selenitireducens]|uniref:Ribosomal-protein-alanine acetyltransferase n=1 Tax=Bacillus selenitireducens (strain ATCC 700615 / DSM 15326 / MLS10) TaxID=439292 RepID=D6XY14_BACIE|nr:ribosomal protein S18-alanine N-acetyltransferase [Salisediminibacterium selenitireducens]ADH98087.1 ribosomal-protein-alanine acetyltransferase [[Bacillus] selenitireducens MLS10]